ncbi:MAG: DNA-binding Lrp family transcriptional regulator [Oceanospirillaceae bacterium]|jgi:DNA-binding Lrp family transcriptional regulator
MQKIISTEATKFKLTDKDRQLLMLLQENARESNASLARKIGVSRATVQERLHKLESAGIIEGYGVRINPQNLHRNIDAIVMMVAENKSFQETFIQMEKMPYIQTIHSLSGEWDWSIFISAPTLEEFHLCITQMNELAGVKSTVSHIIMKTRLDRKNDINNL